ncbi:hypothetical protein BDN70DRAFT_481458 [Pholiota conissans]|uniref:Uncharacterized protein n=1 Tax=Pholiota conissans TaxID=109636 RepID=A0A9P6D3G1_9AGAR|nr:hypothetical protein BDN70DRAFT_481458 [Pholiota conissans]
MKPSTLLFLYIAVLAANSVAAPVPFNLSNDLEPRMDPPPPPEAPKGPISRLSQYVSYKMISSKISRKFKPEKDEAIFWAGRLPGNDPKDPSSSISMEGHARKVAKDEGKSTLEDHLDKYKIKIPDASKNRHSAKLWEKASTTFAHRAHGETHAYLGSYVRPKSVYTTMEKPILMASNRITRLTEHRVHDGTSQVVK